jgi:hypothetical protein
MLPLGLFAITQDDANFGGKTLLGNTPGLYARGEATLVGGTATITLPAWFEKEAAAGGRTVQLTCKDGWSQLWSSAVQNGSLTVNTNSSGIQSQAFYWEVKANQKND